MIEFIWPHWSDGLAKGISWRAPSFARFNTSVLILRFTWVTEFKKHYISLP
jgi:hypothetical protein